MKYDTFSIINNINKYFIKDRTFFSTENIDWCILLRNNYITIKEEYENYINNKNELVKIRDILDADLDNSDINWYAIFLKGHDKFITKNEIYFPKTYELIKKIKGCRGAWFSILEPGKFISLHHGVYNGILRYHLALKTDPENSDKCFIVINSIKYSWKEGQDLLFDDTKTHFVFNNTKTTRVILFLDIKIDFKNLFINSLNNLFMFCKKDLDVEKTYDYKKYN